MITTLSDFIAQVETNDQMHAIRFEPGFAKYVTEASIRACISYASPSVMSRATAMVLLQTSWGRHQIMGENLYALGFKGRLFDYLRDIIWQEFFFSEYCKSRKIDYSLEEVLRNLNCRERFAIKYNGSRDYMLRIRQVAIEQGLLTKDEM